MNLIKTKEKILFSFFSLGFFLLFFLIFFTSNSNAQEVTTSLRVVTTIQSWMGFSISPMTLDLGELVGRDGSLNLGYATTSLIINTNNPGGWEVQIEGKEPYGLYSPATNYAISSVEERSEVFAGVEGYGIIAEPLHPNIEASSPYSYDINYPNHVGPLSSPNLFIYANGETLNAQTLIHIKAGASILTPASIYQDSITFTISITVP